MTKALFAFGLAVAFLSSRIHAQILSYDPIVDVAGVVDVRWRTVTDRFEQQSRVPYFFRASPDDTRRAQQVLAADRDYIQAQIVLDVASLDRILAVAFIGLDEDGRTANKAETLSRIRTTGNDTTEMNRATIRFSDNIAVISGEQKNVAVRKPDDNWPGKRSRGVTLPLGEPFVDPQVGVWRHNQPTAEGGYW